MRNMSSPIARAVVVYMLALVVAFATVASTAHAQRYYRHGTGVQLTANQATSIALNRFPGRVVGTTALVRHHNRLAYKIHIRQNTVRRTVMVDARTGRLDLVKTVSLPRVEYGYPHRR